jgi:hypothetical protein
MESGRALMSFTQKECLTLAALSGLPARSDFWNEVGGVSEFQEAQALMLIEATRSRGWKWRFDNCSEEDGLAWWTVSVSRRLAGMDREEVDKVICLTFPEAVARAALLAELDAF